MDSNAENVCIAVGPELQGQKESRSGDGSRSLAEADSLTSIDADSSSNAALAEPAAVPVAAVPAAAAPSAATAAAAAPPTKLPPWLKPPPNKKSYMPTFSAPEAYGKKADPKYAQARREAEELVVKEKAKKERERQRRRRKKKGGEEEVKAVRTEDDNEAWKLFFLVAFGILTALMEALDADVLFAMALAPFMSAMKFLAAKFDNVNLDPSTWTAKIGEAYNSLCTDNPAGFVTVDFSFFVVCVTLILFEADLRKWWAERNLRAQGYDSLDEQHEDGLTDESLERLFDDIDDNASGGITRDEMEIAIVKVFGKLDSTVVDQMMGAADTDNDGNISLEEFEIIMRAGPKDQGALSQVTKGMSDPDTMQLMLGKAREELEEVDLMIRLRGDSVAPDIKKELDDRHQALTAQVSTLSEYLSAIETEKAEAVDLEAAAAAEAEAEAAKAREGGCAEVTKTLVTVLKNTISGVLTIYLYFMDLISDYQVTMLYYNTGAYRFAAVSACLLIGQFAVVWMRVLPYLQVTYGTESTFYRIFLYFGMPLGCFFFDFLMFLGPFGLLPIVPLPEAMRLFVPAYAATRMIAEVLVEALPQWIMQAVIMVMVSNHVRDGTASPVDKTLYEYQNGSFLSLMPKSILISSLTMIKTWYDLVQEAREAGVSVAQKGVQLWNVGAGLPLDAIKSGSITAWGCAYEISDQEVVSLVDALGKNDSLERLDLSLAGFEWMPPVKREERSALSTLLEVMNQDAKALESLEILVISQQTRWEIPVGALRSGPEKALSVISSMQLLQKGGPEREEMYFMFELLNKNRNPEAGETEIELSYSSVQKIFTDSQKNGEKKVKREAWHKAVAQVITKGMTRRAHFKIIVGAEVLRNVGFGARELLDICFTAEELKAGFFEARELHEVGFNPGALKALGYTPKDLWEAEIPVNEMKQVGYTARELRDGGYTAQQMRNSQAYSLEELKEGKYKPVDLGEAGYLIPDLRAAKFTALDLRKALIFNVQMMRDAGYTASEMKKAGYDAKRINDAGYSAQEASDAGYTLPQMFEADYAAHGIRAAGHSAVLMREAGWELIALKGAGFNAGELMEAGYTAQEIKEAGTSLVQLKAANTPMASLKDIGYTAQRLKQQGYTAAEIALGARGRIDIKTLAILPDVGGYTAKEMRGGPPPHITATELRKGKVFFRIEEWKEGGWATKELREGGYSASEMKACGYMVAELRKSGYSVHDLVDANFLIVDLRDIGIGASELKGAGVTAQVLSDAGYSAKELLVAGFTAAELIACGYGVAALREAGFDAIQLRKLGFSAAELKAYGYGAGPLKEAGSVVKELKELGFSDAELEEAGFARRAVEAVDGRSVRELKEYGGYQVAELREYGYVAAELRGVYTVKDIKDQGYSLDELREGGIPEHAVLAVNGRSSRELRSDGYASKILRKIGFELEELARGDYTATELRQARFGPDELRSVGFTAGALRVAGFTSKQLRSAGYGLREMQEGGFFWKDLVIFLRATHAELAKAGYKDLDQKHELFLLYRPTHDEIYVARTKCKMREGSSLESADAGSLPIGTRVRVLQRSELSDGTMRALVVPEGDTMVLG